MGSEDYFRLADNPGTISPCDLGARWIERLIEGIVGKALKGRRANVVLATKGHLPRGGLLTVRENK